MDRWHAIKAFIGVLELRSYTAAARKLGLSRSHLSKQISSLEDNLGARLLNRTTRHVTPTDIGRAYYEVCSRVIAELEDAESDLAASRELPRGGLKILAPKSLAVLELADFTRAFVNRYPEIDISIFIEDEHLDLVERGFDVALRFGDQRDSSLMVRKIASFQLIACASRGYLKSHGRPQKPADLQQHNCIAHLGLSQNSKWWFKRNGEEFDIPVRGRISSNSTVFLRECVLRGAGIGLMPSYSVKKDIRSRSLVPVLTKYRTASLPLYVVYPGRRHQAVKIRICIDALVEWFGRRFG